MVHPSLPLLLFPLLTTTTSAFLHHSTTTRLSPPLLAKKRDNNNSNYDEQQRPAPSASKLSALEGVLSRIERNYGRGSIVKLGEAESMVVDSFGSGSLTLGAWNVWMYLMCVMLMYVLFRLKKFK
jgi:hypothetical protein